MGVLGIDGRERPVTLCRADVPSDLLRFVADNACASRWYPRLRHPLGSPILKGAADEPRKARPYRRWLLVFLHQQRGEHRAAPLGDSESASKRALTLDAAGIPHRTQLVAYAEFGWLA